MQGRARAYKTYGFRQMAFLCGGSKGMLLECGIYVFLEVVRFW